MILPKSISRETVPSSLNKILSKVIKTTKQQRINNDKNIDKQVNLLKCIFADGYEKTLHPTWLRVNCSTNKYITGQFKMSYADFIGNGSSFENAFIDDASNLSVHWADGHKSTFSANWIHEQAFQLSGQNKKFHKKDDDNEISSKLSLPRIRYDDLFEDRNVVNNYSILLLLNYIFDSGLCIIENVPSKNESVQKIANIISPISHGHLYGDLFDVQDKADANNIAYTTERLCLHQDLIYYESGPGLQFLHALKFDESIIGGESFFLDAFKAAEIFRYLYPDDFEILSNIPATFQKIRGIPGSNVGGEPSKMIYYRPHFQTDYKKRLLNVTWAPPFEGPLRGDWEEMENYFQSYKKFKNFIEISDFAKKETISHRLHDGEMVIFNNRRMLHGRESFYHTDKGTRHLRGCYVNIDEALSRYRSLGSIYGISDEYIMEEIISANGSLAR